MRGVAGDPIWPARESLASDGAQEKRKCHDILTLDPAIEQCALVHAVLLVQEDPRRQAGLRAHNPLRDAEFQ